MPSDIDAERLIQTLLDRIERNARSADKAWQKYIKARVEANDLRGRLVQCQEGNRRRDRDMQSATEKIAEWQEHAAQLKAIIGINTRRFPKLKQFSLPPEPGPLETEIPF